MTSKRTSRISTKVPLEIKEKWHEFLLRRHGTIRSVYGIELAKAMILYMRSFDHNTKTCSNCNCTE